MRNIFIKWITWIGLVYIEIHVSSQKMAID